MLALDDQPPSGQMFWNQAHFREAGYLVELKLHIAARCLYACRRYHVDSYEHNGLDVWK